MLRNGWIPTGPPLRKPTSARVALDRQHLVLDNGTRDPDLLVGLSRRAETYTTDFLRGVRSLRNHGSPLGSPSELPEVGFVDSLLSGREDETLVVGDADPAVHAVRLMRPRPSRMSICQGRPLYPPVGIGVPPLLSRR